MKAPFPYFGGKSLIAEQVWERLGADTAGYVEPFCGSAAVLLARPGWHRRVTWTETINDADGMVANFWRATKAEPEVVAEWADWPVNENDLHARHAWLVARKESLQERLEGDPEFYDAKIAGWWVWGMACWIGHGFCSGEGPWHVVDGRLVHLGNDGQGVNRRAGDIYEWFEALAARLARVRVCSGDWTRVLTPTARGSHHNDTVAVFLDPPYSAEAGRDTNIYTHDDLDVAHAVAGWCAENGDDPGLRIALCGYSGEGHEHLEAAGWTAHVWSATGGYSKQGGNSYENRHRETVWFSPHCETPAQATLFGEPA